MIGDIIQGRGIASGQADRAGGQFWNLDEADRLRAVDSGIRARDRQRQIQQAQGTAYGTAISGQAGRVSPMAAARAGRMASERIGMAAAREAAQAHARDQVRDRFAAAARRASQPDRVMQGIGSALNVGGQVLGFALPMMAPAGQAASAAGRDLQEPGSGGPAGGMLAGIISGKGPQMGGAPQPRLGHHDRLFRRPGHGGAADMPETMGRVDSALGLAPPAASSAPMAATPPRRMSSLYRDDPSMLAPLSLGPR